jgi:hypothetical protein
MGVYGLGSEAGEWIEIANDMEECWMPVSTVMSIVNASRRATNEVKFSVLLTVSLDTIRVKKTNLMHCLSSVYFFIQPLHVSGIYL